MRRRPHKSFDDLCNQSKIGKTTELRNMCIVNESRYATKVSLKYSGVNDAYKLLEELIINIYI